ncbi:DUF1624 domain-containing protein [Dyadobacter bucti]|uniref:DUF1624 domain-containing protein n=1 Tax=Dyadobacter bucti TaxID=2572203 RepID=UPI001107DF87|nr:heparan-alpha-glucosaminide N-acetyltransferase domain-containing protein [Dyadobacter bucti]
MTPLDKNRIRSIDLLKGLVMVLMVLDHTRDYFYQSSSVLSITDPENATFPVYTTRWITHFCAPTFSFLAGMSVFLSGKRKTKTDLSIFLLKRGLWLVFLELTVIAFAWYFDIRFRNIDLAVIWCLGISMIFLAAVIHLPKGVILLLSCLLIFGHNLLDKVHFEGSALWSVLHELSHVELSDTHTLNIIYPIIPWIGVMSLGYYFGNFYRLTVEASARKRLFNTIGFLAVALFVVVRWINVYGDPSPWKHYATVGQTVMSFLNVTKYPPSLLYLLVTLSGAFLFLANSETWKGKLVDFFCVFGRVPFFYYIMHLYLIRTLAAVAAELTGYGWQLMVQTQFDIDLKDYGFSLGVVYAVWVGIILVLYPFCRQFDAYKQSHREKWWLSYL